MKHTHASTLVVLAVIGGVGGFLLQIALASSSLAKLRPEYTLAITLVFIAVLVVALAIPVRRATRGRVRRPIDPFYATRVVVLAKASALGGALLAGVGAGLLIELLVRSGTPTGDAFLRTIATFVAALALLVAGLVAEHLCTVPPDRDEHGKGPQGAPS